MQRLTVLVASCVCCLVVNEGGLLAENTWCSTNHPEGIFCADFDRYCVDPPPEPEACPVGAVRTGMADIWNVEHNCGWVPGVHDEYYSSSPFCVKIGCQDGGNHLGYANMGLNNFAKAKFGAAYTAVLATDLTPLTFEFAMNGRTFDKIRSGNIYVELGYGRTGDLIPGQDSLTNWVISDNCQPCGDTSDNTGYWPILCRQRSRPGRPMPAACPNIDTASIIPAIAAGAVAFLDNNPCHCGESGYHWPHATRLAFFDGREWFILGNGLFPDPGGSEPATGNFELVTGDVQHRVRFTITSTKVTVEMRAAGVLSRCQVPLAYIGPSSSILMGFQAPCQLQAGTWSCNGAPDCNGPCGSGQSPQVCCLRGAPGGGTVTVDDVAVQGGQGYADPGACCFPDTTCLDNLRQGDCTVLGGNAAAPTSTCAATACCPPLLVDHDMDTDVDVEDFGWFQTCLSSGTYLPPPTLPCACADLDGDVDVDIDDFTIFAGCMLGPGIPADPGCAG
ncbi:MAG: hypothetical protein HY718_21090 [Planctomycetes bacterium]|nr:hypothetical protein [Planctomycetota bacterium]